MSQEQYARGFLAGRRAERQDIRFWLQRTRNATHRLPGGKRLGGYITGVLDFLEDLEAGKHVRLRAIERNGRQDRGE